MMPLISHNGVLLSMKRVPCTDLQSVISVEDVGTFLLSSYISRASQS